LAYPRNDTAAGRLAQGQQSDIKQAYEGGRLVFPKQRDPTMGLFTKDIKTMNDLFVHQLKDIYYAERQLVKALPDMAEKATDP
jgi:uncharacterized protein DUF892